MDTGIETVASCGSEMGKKGHSCQGMLHMGKKLNPFRVAAVSDRDSHCETLPTAGCTLDASRVEHESTGTAWHKLA